MTETLYRTDPYLKQAEARVAAITPEGGVVLDRTIFYPTGGGQPGDAGVLTWGSREIAIATTAKGEAGAVVLIPGEAAALPEPGERVLQSLDWDRRYRHMRVGRARCASSGSEAGRRRSTSSPAAARMWPGPER
jgi:misacylated tRNA(Ala) deacylase